METKDLGAEFGPLSLSLRSILGITNMEDVDACTQQERQRMSGFCESLRLTCLQT